ncbi:MAG TPA: sigma-54 dependent transcriptional regulator [Candidatus Eisenbacteria bacterium]|jgi:DNA-binding NtrC family response regulator
MILNVGVVMPPGPERDTLVAHISGEGWSVRVADSAEQFAARSGDEPCEVAILDFPRGPAPNASAADGDSTSLARKRDSLRVLKERWPNVQLVILSERASQDAAETLELGVRNVLLKPIRTESLDGLLRAASRSVAQLKRQQRESIRIESEFRFERILGESAAIREAIDLARRVASSSATSVLILGESGVGKELFARAIHGESPRKQGPFMEVNCAAIPRELLESELFGHEKGAFTDATQLRVGLFEAAEHGSVFLDEVGELPLTLQAKLLKFLDSKIVRRVGGSRDIPVDVRILTATNRDLHEEVRAGRFREDLFYRLNVVPIRIPPLRARGSDSVRLARHFVERVARKLGRKVVLTPAGEREIQRYSWPGNVRELANALERAVLLARGAEIGPAELQIPRGPDDSSFSVPDLSELKIRIPAEGVSLRMIERAVIEAALARTSGNVVEAARLLKIGRGSLRSKMKRHGLGQETRVPLRVA